MKFLSLLLLLLACSPSFVANTPPSSMPSLHPLRGEIKVTHDLGVCQLCDVYHHALDYVVQVRSGQSLGAGVVVAENGEIVTNAHVVQGVTTVNVVLHNNLIYQATVVRVDEKQDLALLRVEDAIALWKPVAIAKSKLPRIGSDVYVIGHPEGLGWTVSQGIVSGYRKAGEISAVDYVQTDAAISPGNSGGPLLDVDGNLLGIITSKLVNQEVDNVAFARPVSALLQFLGSS